MISVSQLGSMWRWGDGRGHLADGPHDEGARVHGLEDPVGVSLVHGADEPLFLPVCVQETHFHLLLHVDLLRHLRNPRGGEQQPSE